MNAKQLERASYMAAHAILSSDVSAPYLATPGARRSYTVDAIAEQIKGVFELHCSALDEPAEWWPELAAMRRPTRTVQPGETGQKLQLLRGNRG